MQEYSTVLGNEDQNSLSKKENMAIPEGKEEFAKHCWVAIMH